MGKLTPYQYGFLSKCAEANVPEDIAVALYKRAVEINIPDNYAGNMALGAGAGALAGLAEEAMSGNEDKHYLRTAAKRALLSTALMAGATYLGAPNLYPNAKQVAIDAKNKLLPPAVSEKTGAAKPGILRRIGKGYLDAGEWVMKHTVSKHPRATAAVATAAVPTAAVANHVENNRIRRDTKQKTKEDLVRNLVDFLHSDELEKKPRPPKRTNPKPNPQPKAEPKPQPKAEPAPAPKKGAPPAGK